MTAKEKLSEEDVQAYKYWLIDRSREDNFESLVEWVELHVQVMEEAKEETKGIEKMEKREEQKKRFRGFNTRSTTRHCVVETCNEDHPPWVCKAFSDLPVSKRRELIAKTGRCYCCLATVHRSKDCTRTRICGVGGCKSKNHSSYLHDSYFVNQRNKPPASLRTEAPQFQPREVQPENREQPNPGSIPPTNVQTQERMHKTTKIENVSLMVIPALIGSGNRELNVNAMLDPCSTSSYISEEAAAELQLNGQAISLTIAGTGGMEIHKRSRRVELKVTSLATSA